jgi:hypothetical protein
MAEQQVEQAKRTIKVKNTSPRGTRFVYDATGKQHLLGPGQEAEIEVTEPTAKLMEEGSKRPNSTIQVEGHEPEPPEPDENAPEIPEEHRSRVALAEAERDLMEEGQEGDKERREKAAKKPGTQLAAETGIRMHARGLKPEVKTAPADAPAKKKA